ncbi:MAG TPA: membrane dipeptidase [Vicinamibacterales bacterium]|jgi:membrane dipeptidase
MRQLWAVGMAAGLATAGLTAQDDALTAKARAIHERVMTLDTHNDINPSNFTSTCNYTMDLGNQVNLPKMIKGGLDASFFIVYVGQDTGPDAFTPAGYDRAYKSAIEKFDAIHRLSEQIAPDKIGLALTAADARRIHASGRKVAFIGVENGYPIGEDLSRIKEFYDRGARYLSLAHNGHSQLSDSNTGEVEGWKWHGLSPLGKQAIAEMNKVGIMIDVSHPSKESMMQAIQLSKAPIIASHSAMRALADVSRNLDDEQLAALKKNGGVVQVVAFASYVKTDSPERKAALDALRKEFNLPPGTNLGGGGGRGARGGNAIAAPNPCATGGERGAGRADAPAAGARGGGQGRGRGGALAALGDDQRTDLQKKLEALNARIPPPTRASVKDFVDHIDYAVKKVGIDHVGISSDFDGGGGVDGWNGADETFNVTLELVKRGYSEDQIARIWSGNLLRVMDEVQAAARKLR